MFLPTTGCYKAGGTVPLKRVKHQMMTIFVQLFTKHDGKSWSILTIYVQDSKHNYTLIFFLASKIIPLILDTDDWTCPRKEKMEIIERCLYNWFLK